MVHKQNTLKDLHEGCLDVFRYYSVFNYPLTAQEVHRYFPVKIDYNAVETLLIKLASNGDLLKSPNIDQYALRGHGMQFKLRAQKYQTSLVKITRAQRYARILSIFPIFWMICLTGSCSMNNAVAEDDIDIFIVSAPGCMWLSRLIAVCIAKAMNMHRSYGSVNVRNTMCLNLFFDARDYLVPYEKQNRYIAHEIAQMRPLYIRGGVYSNFLRKNHWYKHYLPNAQAQPCINTRSGSFGYAHPRIFALFLPFELISKHIQMMYMKPRGAERITKNQLWFFPDDFELKIRKKIVIS